MLWNWWWILSTWWGDLLFDHTEWDSSSKLRHEIQWPHSSLQEGRPAEWRDTWWGWGGESGKKVEDYGEDALVFGWGRIADIRFFSLWLCLLEHVLITFFFQKFQIWESYKSIWRRKKGLRIYLMYDNILILFRNKLWFAWINLCINYLNILIFFFKVLPVSILTNGCHALKGKVHNRSRQSPLFSSFIFITLAIISQA